MVVEQTGDQIVVSLNLADATFFTYLQANNVKRVFKVVITFNPAKHTATVENNDFSLEQRGGVGGYGMEMAAFKGESYEWHYQAEGGMKPDGSVGVAYSYLLDSIKLNKDIKQVLASNGWKIARTAVVQGAIYTAGFGLFVSVVIGLLIIFRVIG